MSAVGSVGVLICTHDARRLAMVREAVASVRRQSVPPTELVVMVDGTEDLAAQVREVLPDTKVECMGSNQGCSAARNAGVAGMTTDFVAFLDDDAVADPEWVARVLGPLSEPQVIGVTAASLAIFDAPRPAWLPDEFLWAFGCSYRGLPATTARVRNVFGGTAIFRRGLFLELGGYDVGVGAHGAMVGGGEEAEFCLRATARTGGWFVYEPRAVVHHHVPPQRLTWGYFARRCYEEGVMKARLAAIHSGPSLGEERAFAAALPRGVLRCLRTPSEVPRIAGVVVGALAVVIGLAVGKVRPGPAHAG